jgi:hypothetical protein
VTFVPHFNFAVLLTLIVGSSASADEAPRLPSSVMNARRFIRSPRRRAEKSRNAGYGAKQRLDSPGNTTISCYGKASARS